MSLLKGMAADLTFGEAGEPFKLGIPEVSEELMVMIGQNGSGKTMFLTCTWFATFMLGIYQVALAATPSKADTLFAENATAAAQMTFNNADSMSGMFVFSGKQEELEFEFIMRFENGSLVDFNIEINDPTDFAKLAIQPVIFNSKEARMFTSYERYLDILEMADVQEPRTIKDFKKVAKLHKLYDILWFEHVRGKLNQWAKFGMPPMPKSQITNFHTNWPSDDDAFGPNPKLEVRNNIPWIVSDTVNKKVSAFGSGHQAVLMTTLFV